MIIRLIESTDNISDYLECVKELNSKNVELSSVEQIRGVLIDRPSNILTFVGLVSDRIVSTATVVIEKKLRYRRLCCHIEDVGVHPDHRNKEYGKQIVEYCISVAKSNNCYKIKLNCHKGLTDFYKKLGFETDSFGMVLSLQT